MPQQTHGNCTTQAFPRPQPCRASSVRIVGPAELGGQRLQVSQLPEGVSGDGIHATGDSDGVFRDLSKRMLLHVSAAEEEKVPACLEQRT